MRKFFILFLFPLFIFSHITDERLFTTSDVPSSVLLLLDRSGSMCITTYNYDILVRLNDYNNGNRDEELSEWYDSTLIPDGPGAMSDFDGGDANCQYVLEIDWTNWWTWHTPRVDLSWTLMIKSGGSWYTYDGGSHTWWGRRGSRRLTIEVTGLGTIEDIQCYLDIELDHMDIEDMQIDLIKTPRDTPYESTRIKDALLVIHSLLDADNDGFVTEEDEDYLPVKLGMGFHFKTNEYTFNDSRSYNTPHYVGTGEGTVLDTAKIYDETSKQWILHPDGTLNTDSIGSSFVDVWNHINSSVADGSTPNGPLVHEVVEYIDAFKDKHEDLWCMSHNIILITDGLSNSGYECTNGSEDVVRQAYKAWHEDSVKVFAVGFGEGITTEGENELNWVGFHGGTRSADSAFIDSMISNSLMDTTDVPADVENCDGMPNPQDHFLTGYAYIAKDANALASALGKIFREIAGSENKTFTAAEVTSVEEEFLSTEYQSRLYLASFVPDTLPVWHGNLKALELPRSGELDLDDIPDSLIIWEAGDSVADDSADSRPIYGIKSDTMLPFDTLNFTAADLDVSSAKLYSVIDRVRDGCIDDSLGELGDIFHSSPLRIQSPNYFYEDQGWDHFLFTLSENRSPLLYAGGNDGMLHVFADDIKGTAGKGGHEIAGIIPMNFVPKVKNLLSYHDYFVDGDPIAADVWFPVDNSDKTKEWNEWHTVLIATQGEGGRSFTAFDVTDPLGEIADVRDSINFLFDAWQSDTLKKILGYTTSTPIIYKVGINWSHTAGRVIDRFYCFMGGGQYPDPMDLSVVDSIEAGTVKGNTIIAFDVWKAATRGIDSGLVFIPPAKGDTMKYPFVAPPSIVNIDPEIGNRYDFLFIPDAAGQLWFVNLKITDQSKWRARRLFAPPVPASSDSAQVYNWHPAYYRPLVWKDPNRKSCWVAYGTGNRSNIFAESAERFYTMCFDSAALYDTSDITFYTEDSLELVDTTQEHSRNKKGWRFELTHDREKVVTPALYYQGSLEFYTFSPGGDTVLGPCDIGGAGSVARSYSFRIKTGYSGHPEGIAVGSGMPQSPSFSFSISGEGVKILPVGGKLKSEETGSFTSFREHKLWKDEDRD
jgi:hypothetical protein